METNISKLHIDSSGQADSVVHLGSKEDFTFHSTIDNKKSMKLLKTLSVFGGVLLTVGFFFFMATSMRISQSNSTKGFDFSKDEVSNFGEDFTMLASYDGTDYVNVFNTLLSKKYRFIILKRDTYNTNTIKLDAGPWEWLFSDFANAVDQYSEQVGFIFLGQKGKENLYMVVFNPKYQSRNAAQVLEGFRLPTEPKVLQKWGLPTVNYFVTRDKADLTLDNVIMTSKTTGIISFLEDDSLTILTTANHSYEHLNNEHLPQGIIRRERHHTLLLDDDSSPMLSTMDSLDQDLE